MAGRFPILGWLGRLNAWARSHTLVVDSALAVLLAASFGTLTLLVLVDNGSEPAVGDALATHAPWTVGVVLALFVEHVALCLRRVRPLASFVLVSATVGVQILTSVWWLLPSVLLYLVSLYSYCAYGRHPAPFIGVLVAAGGAVPVTFAGFALAGQTVQGVDPLTHLAIRELPFVLAAWALGMWCRVRLAYVAALHDRAVRAEAEREERARRAAADERARIAREMHDVIAHALSVVISQAQGGRYAARADPAHAVEALTTIAGTGRRALADMRGVLAVLRTDTATSEDNDGIPQPTLAELPDLFDRLRDAGLSVNHTEGGSRLSLSPAAELAAFRVVQEALTNTLKHAGPAARATVHLHWSGQGLTVTVYDDGPGPSTTDGGHGLIGMRERMAAVGGSISTEQPADGGFRVRAHLPEAARMEPSQ